MLTQNNKGRLESWKSVIKRAVKWYVAVVLFGLMVCIGIAYSYIAYAKNHPVYVDREVVKLVTVPREVPPVLQRIAQCESSGKHKNSKGVLIINKNSDGSEDVGLYQINIKYWGLKAMELGYNLTNEVDNTSFAVWLYENKGTEPWIHSKNCWNK